MLGRIIRDITRKIVGRPELADVFALPLSRARRVKDKRQRQRGRPTKAARGAFLDKIRGGPLNAAELPGAVAQLGERCNRTAEVRSSILLGSTINLDGLVGGLGWAGGGSGDGRQP